MNIRIIVSWYNGKEHLIIGTDMTTDNLFRQASELNGEDLQSIKSGYVRGAIVRDLIITVVTSALVGVICFFINVVPTLIAVIVLCVSGVAGLFSFVSFITELVTLGRIGKGDFVWTSGEVKGYQFYTVRRITYLYAVVDNNFCNIWANPIYGKGTEVYLLEVGSGMTAQKVMVSR